jgi:glycosyltransferase involved in cell wall biosynthesis
VNEARDEDQGPRPRASVIVPARNAAAKIGSFIAAIQRQTAAPADYELLIVDDCSTDATAAKVRESGSAQLLSLPEHGGPYVARNRGIEAARADVLVFTDADCEPAGDWIERGLDALQTSGADLIAGNIDVPLGERPSAAQLVDFSSWYDQEDFASRGVAATGNLWVRREVLSRIGGFDESLMSSGDMDLTERAVGHGFRLEYAGDVVVTHLPESYWHLLKKGYRLGRGAAARGRPHLLAWLRGGDPDWRAARRSRPAIHGYTPGPWKRLSMFLVKNFLIRLPILAGNLTGMAARLRGRQTG